MLYYIARLGLWFALMAVIGLLFGMLGGCASDFQSPFDAPTTPDETAQPVQCVNQGCAK